MMAKDWFDSPHAEEAPKAIGRPRPRVSNTSSARKGKGGIHIPLVDTVR